MAYSIETLCKIKINNINIVPLMSSVNQLYVIWVAVILLKHVQQTYIGGDWLDYKYLCIILYYIIFMYKLGHIFSWTYFINELIKICLPEIITWCSLSIIYIF